MKSRSNKGFTVLELMIVVVIVGFLAALAIPPLMRSTIRAKQAEAKETLKQIYIMQQAYKLECKSYCLDGAIASVQNPEAFASINIKINLPARYTYTMTATDSTFQCMARANLDDDATNDVWAIDETGTLSCLVDDSEL